MKTNNVTTQASQVSVNNSERQELETFNRRRAARGLLPVTQEEFNELLMKIAGLTTFSLSTLTFH
jgi:hypothetical protein